MYLRLFVIFVLSSMLASCGSTRWSHPNLTQSKFDMDVNNCRYQSQMATQQQPRQETYEQSMQRSIALAQMSPGAAAQANLHSGANQMGNAIGAIVNEARIFEMCMFRAGYSKQ